MTEDPDYDEDPEHGELGSLFANPDPRWKHSFTFVSMVVTQCDRAEATELGKGAKVVFVFSYGSITIESTMVIPLPPPLDALQRRLLLYVGMNVLTWYWMGYATHSITVLPGAAWPPLSHEEIEYFEGLYNNVLAEFMFVNQLCGKIRILNGQADGISEENKDTLAAKARTTRGATTAASSSSPSDTVLIPLGGGKDSLVVWEMAFLENRPVAFLYVADGPYEFEGNSRLAALMRECAATAAAGRTGSSVVWVARHSFRSSTFEHTKHSHTPVGHPWASLCYFDGLLLAELTGVKECWLGFESSADEGNGMVDKNGIAVNHQYDKSAPFMSLTTAFVARTYANFARDELDVPPVVKSPLSTVSELLIARRFALSPSLRRVHGVFLSCNEPRHNKSGVKVEDAQWEWHWCQRCEKCCFVFLLLCAWLPPVEVCAILGSDLFGDAAHHAVPETHSVQDVQAEARRSNAERLRQMFLSLVGSPGTVKPFECVGTTAESQCAALLALRRWPVGEQPEVLLEMAAVARTCSEEPAESSLRLELETEHWLQGASAEELGLLQQFRVI